MNLFNDHVSRWEKKNPGHGREELTAMQALDLLVNVKTLSPGIILICSGPPGKRPPSPTGGRGRGRGRGSSMPYYDRWWLYSKHICPLLIFCYFELWPVMSLPSKDALLLFLYLCTVNHFSRNRSMDDDLEGRAREREAPSAERGFPKTLLFSRKILAQF